MGVQSPQKITFGEMGESGVRGALIYCSDYACSHSITANADPWPDHIRLSDLEPRSSVQLAAGAERTSDQIFTGTSRAPLVRLCWSFVPDDLSAFASKKPNG
jgi:hypothetical protein